MSTKKRETPWQKKENQNIRSNAEKNSQISVSLTLSFEIVTIPVAYYTRHSHE